MASFLDELRAVREQVIREAHKEVPVPGSGGRIVVKFRAPTTQDARERLTGVVAAYRIGSALSDDQEKQLLVDCCDEILYRGENGELEQPDGDGPLRFDAGDERWGDDVKSARDCVAKLYNLDTVPLAAAGVADALVDWLQGIDAEVAARVGKDSPPATPAPS